MIEKEESVPNLLTAFSKNFEIHKNQNLKLFSFLLFFK